LAANCRKLFKNIKYPSKDPLKKEGAIINMVCGKTEILLDLGLPYHIFLATLEVFSE